MNNLHLQNLIWHARFKKKEKKKTFAFSYWCNGVASSCELEVGFHQSTLYVGMWQLV